MRYIVGKIHIIRGCAVVGGDFGNFVIGGGGVIDLTVRVSMGLLWLVWALVVYRVVGWCSRRVMWC